MRSVLMACALLGSACATDFGPIRDYLPCADDGGCADGFQCATMDIGRVCLAIREFENQCTEIELCNGRDDSCDGLVDEAFTDLGSVCTVGVGACAVTGTVICKEDASGTQCSATPGLPHDEVCNGRDDDCDGDIDEDLTEIVTGSDIGECQPQVEWCTDGVLDIAQGAVTPKGERCNFLDDDCDGAYDEDFFPPLDEACEVGIGACKAFGSTICAPDGASAMCSAEEGAPTLDVCDGEDNDCDGEVDQVFIASLDLGAPCANGIGPCSRPGTMVCTGDGFSTVCDAVPGAPTLEVCDGEDNDCNSLPDDGLPSCCLPGDSQYCSTNVGECDFGTQVCAPDRTWGPCTGFLPTVEVCDGLDNDCNGAVDDGVTNCCEPGDRTSCSTDEGACTAGEQECGVDRSWGLCLSAPGTPAVLPTIDLCDGEDNDCDGHADEDFPGVRVDACSAGIGPCRRDGVMECRADGFGTVCGAVPVAGATEICDGLDNDCDGTPDDDLGSECCSPDDVRGCSLNIGECTVGTQVCGEDRAWGVCSGREPDPEVCDGLDNDCDGRTDEAVLDCCDAGQRLSCSTDEGECTAGEQECGEDRAWGDCLTPDGSPAVLPVADLCDGVDNDCDGSADESFAGLAGICTVGVGACAASGLRICRDDGDGTRCSVSPGTPSPERCDGSVDEDCDGHTDEPWDGYLTRACSEGVGACEDDGVWQCTADGLGVECTAEVGSPSEEVCDGVDNDCGDGVDEGVESVLCYDGLFETLDVGECRAGMTVCEDGRENCDGDVVPVAELCDGLDNDCDGVVDGSLVDAVAVPFTAPCYTGRPDTADVGECRSGVTTCRMGKWGACEDEALPTSEVCGDAFDTDCDGRDDGITFLEDFEDDCAMPEATVVSDVTFDCVPTPVDTEDPSRTPAGERSLGVILIRGDENLITSLAWQFTTCAAEVTGSIAIFLARFINGAALTLSLSGTGDRIHLVLRPGDNAVVVEYAAGGSDVIPVTREIVLGQWSDLRWVFSEGNRISFFMDGSSVYDGVIAAEIRGMEVHGAVSSVSGVIVDMTVDDVHFMSP